jgi:protein TonB
LTAIPALSQEPSTPATPISSASGVQNGGGDTAETILHVGGSVHPPVVIHTVDPKFSDAARKAKFSGKVLLYLVVDENGNPQHIRVARGVGMGLDEKAVEAVRQYRFKPATLNDKPVKVDLYVQVSYQFRVRDYD